MKKLKKKNRLTFDLDEVEEPGYKVKSSHDMLRDEKLSNKVAVDTETLEQKLRERQEEEAKKREMKDRLIGGERD